MKRTPIPVVIFLIAMLTASSSYALDLKDGFSEIRWGGNISGSLGLSKLYDKDSVAYYANPGQIHTIFDVDIPEVTYGFSTGRFFSVYITIETMGIFMELKRELKKKYGLPDIKTSVKTGETIYKWKYDDIKIKLKARDKENELKLAFYYTPISSQVNEDLLEDVQDERYKFLPIDRDKQPKALPLLIF